MLRFTSLDQCPSVWDVVLLDRRFCVREEWGAQVLTVFGLQEVFVCCLPLFLKAANTGLLLASVFSYLYMVSA